MKICVFTHTYPRYDQDPVAPFMKDFCEGLMSKENKIFLVTPFDPLFKLTKKNSLTVKLYKYIFPQSFHVLGYSRTLIGDQQLVWYVYFLAPFQMFFSFFALLRIVREERIDIISAHWILPNGFIAALVSLLTGTPLVITIPGSDVYLAKKNVFFRMMCLIASYHAKTLVSNSMEYLVELSTIGINKKKFIEIPYGVDVQKFRDVQKKKWVLRKMYGFKKNDYIILATGRLVEKKGFTYVIKAMPYVIKEQQNARLLIVGDGSEKNKLEHLVKRLKMNTHILFVGKVNHNILKEYFAVADIAVAASIKDSRGNLESHIVALFEAIASGLPVVATTRAVNKQYVVDGVNGFRVPEKNERALAEAIIKVCKAKNKRSMTKKSKQIAETYLSHQKSAESYMRVFNDVLASAN